MLRVAVCGFIFGNVSYPAGLQILIPHGLAKQRMHVMFIVGLDQHSGLLPACVAVWCGRCGQLAGALRDPDVYRHHRIMMVKHDILKTYLARPAVFKQPGNEHAG